MRALQCNQLITHRNQAHCNSSAPCSRSLTKATTCLTLPLQADAWKRAAAAGVDQGFGKDNNPVAREGMGAPHPHKAATAHTKGITSHVVPADRHTAGASSGVLAAAARPPKQTPCTRSHTQVLVCAGLWLPLHSLLQSFTVYTGVCGGRHHAPNRYFGPSRNSGTSDSHMLAGLSCWSAL